MQNTASHVSVPSPAEVMLTWLPVCRKGVKYHRQERSSTFASRSIRMPETADLGKIGARYQDGVLLLTVPKQADMTAKHRQIQIQ